MLKNTPPIIYKNKFVTLQFQILRDQSIFVNALNNK